MKHQLPTMDIKNRRNSSKLKGLGSYQTLSLTERLELLNRLLFIYSPLRKKRKKCITCKDRDRSFQGRALSIVQEARLS